MLTMQQIFHDIEQLPSMSALPPEQFAEDEGLAESFIYHNHDLKPNQLRRVFHHVKDLQRELAQGGTFDRSQVAMIMPLLAYGVGRGLIPENFYKLMKLCFGSAKCRTQADFDTAANFLEAIMAYHKYYDKKS